MVSDGRFEHGRWIPEPPAPREPMMIEITLDTARLERQLNAVAGGLSGIACAIDEMLLALKGANT